MTQPCVKRQLCIAHVQHVRKSSRLETSLVSKLANTAAVNHLTVLQGHRCYGNLHECQCQQRLYFERQCSSKAQHLGHQYGPPGKTCSEHHLPCAAGNLASLYKVIYSQLAQYKGTSIMMHGTHEQVVYPSRVTLLTVEGLRTSLSADPSSAFASDPSLYSSYGPVTAISSPASKGYRAPPGQASSVDDLLLPPGPLSPPPPNSSIANTARQNAAAPGMRAECCRTNKSHDHRRSCAHQLAWKIDDIMAVASASAYRR